MRINWRHTSSFIMGLLALPTTLAQNIGQPMQQDVSLSDAISLQPIDLNPILPTDVINNPLETDYLLAKNAMNLAFFESLIIHDSPYMRTRVAKMLEEVYESHPDTAHYMRVALTRLPFFKVIIAPANSIQIQEKWGMYDNFLQILYLNEKDITPENRNYVLSLLRHELRHASFHAVQLILSKQNTFNTDCFFPNHSEKEKALVTTLIEKGNQRLAKMRSKLIKEFLGTLNKKEQEKLNEIRKSSCHEEYLRDYTNFGSADEKAFSTIEIALLNMQGVQLHPGNKINIDQYGDPVEMLGDIEITRVEYNEQDGLTYITFIFQDPLQAAWHRMDYASHQLKSSYYKPYQYLYEKDAYLQSYLPPLLIKTFYPEWIAYTENLFNKTLLNSSPSYNKPLLYWEKSEAELIDLEITIIVSDPMISKEYATMHLNNYQAIIHQLVKENKLDLAKVALKNLIQHGFDLKESKRVLNEIEVYQAYHAEKYKNKKSSSAQVSGSTHHTAAKSKPQQQDKIPAAAPVTDDNTIVQTCVTLGAAILATAGFCLFSRKKSAPLQAMPMREENNFKRINLSSYHSN